MLTFLQIVMKPDFVVPLVATLVHPSCQESGSIFEAAAGHYSKIRWERSRGFLARPDENMTAGLLIRNHDKIVDYTNAEHPNGVADSMALLQQTTKLPPNPPNNDVNFKDKVVLVTGAGEGLGRAHAKYFARLGAKVVVNDIKFADKVAQDIKSAGGEATALTMSVEEGQKVVEFVVKTYGRIDILVNNAGILGDKAFMNQTDDLWYPVMSVHLRSTYLITRAAWPYFLKQKYGRVVNTTSTSGVYGNFGQSNYAAAVGSDNFVFMSAFANHDNRNAALLASAKPSLEKGKSTTFSSTQSRHQQAQT
jgi:multifunctional beta-oxidation protein